MSSSKSAHRVAVPEFALLTVKPESLLNPTPVQTHSAPQYDTEVQYNGGQQYNGGLQFGGGLQFSGGQQHSIGGKLSSATAGTSSLATSESLLSPATVQAHRAPQYEASLSTDPKGYLRISSDLAPRGYPRGYLGFRRGIQSHDLPEYHALPKPPAEITVRMVVFLIFH
jgi:hypothetical protein